MPYSSIDEGGEFRCSFLEVFRARVETGKEFSWDDPVGPGEGDWSFEKIDDDMLRGALSIAPLFQS
jgi:hypothetical protein